MAHSLVDHNSWMHANEFDHSFMNPILEPLNEGGGKGKRNGKGKGNGKKGKILKKKGGEEEEKEEGKAKEEVRDEDDDTAGIEVLPRSSSAFKIKKAESGPATTRITRKKKGNRKAVKEKGEGNGKDENELLLGKKGKRKGKGKRDEEGKERRLRSKQRSKSEGEGDDVRAEAEGDDSNEAEPVEGEVALVDVVEEGEAGLEEEAQEEGEELEEWERTGGRGRARRVLSFSNDSELDSEGSSISMTRDRAHSDAICYTFVRQESFFAHLDMRTRMTQRNSSKGLASSSSSSKDNANKRDLDESHSEAVVGRKEKSPRNSKSMAFLMIKRSASSSPAKSSASPSSPSSPSSSIASSSSPSSPSTTTDTNTATATKMATVDVEGKGPSPRQLEASEVSDLVDEQVGDELLRAAAIRLDDQCSREFMTATFGKGVGSHLYLHEIPDVADVLAMGMRKETKKEEAVAKKEKGVEDGENENEIVDLETNVKDDHLEFDRENDDWSDSDGNDEDDMETSATDLLRKYFPSSSLVAGQSKHQQKQRQQQQRGSKDDERNDRGKGKEKEVTSEGLYYYNDGDSEAASPPRKAKVDASKSRAEKLSGVFHYHSASVETSAQRKQRLKQCDQQPLHHHQQQHQHQQQLQQQQKKSPVRSLSERSTTEQLMHEAELLRELLDLSLDDEGFQQRWEALRQSTKGSRTVRMPFIAPYRDSLAGSSSSTATTVERDRDRRMSTIDENEDGNYGYDRFGDDLEGEVDRRQHDDDERVNAALSQGRSLQDLINGMQVEVEKLVQASEAVGAAATSVLMHSGARSQPPQQQQQQQQQQQRQQNLNTSSNSKTRIRFQGINSTDASDASMSENGEAGANGEDTCVICLEAKDFSGFVTLPICGHRFCLDCVRTHIEVSVNDAKASSITCMNPLCRRALANTEIETLVSTDLFERYERFLDIEQVNKNPYARWCPRADCNTSIVIKAGDRRVVCSNCGCDFCALCKLEHPRKTSCNKVMRRRLRNNPTEKEAFRWVKKNTKPCPACRLPIEKAGGCHNVHCGTCQTLFCWECGKALGPGVKHCVGRRVRTGVIVGVGAVAAAPVVLGLVVVLAAPVGLPVTGYVVYRSKKKKKQKRNGTYVSKGPWAERSVVHRATAHVLEKMAYELLLLLGADEQPVNQQQA